MFKLLANKKIYETSINAEQLQQILDSIITSDLGDHSFKKVLPYSWRNTDAVFKQAINYTELKGASGTLTWGVNIDFIPVVMKDIEWFRTDKKFLLHLSDHPTEYKQSFIGGNISNGISTHWGEKKARKTITYLWEKNRNNILSWFKEASTIEGLIRIAQDQITNNKLYIIHHPKGEYVLPFLFAKAGKIETAIELFNKLDLYHFNKDEVIKNKVRDILIDMRPLK